MSGASGGWQVKKDKDGVKRLSKGPKVDYTDKIQPYIKAVPEKKYEKKKLIRGSIDI